MTESENVAPAANGESVDEKVVRQLEYYFGNINLPRDRFLQDSMKQDEGWVPIKTLLTFNRLASITTDAEVIANAVKAADSEIISISEDGQKIRRNIGNPLPENSLEYWQKIKHCTVYMKGFEQNTTLDEIMTFAKKFGQVENVLMRRTKPDRIFKGSVFITYKTREEAEKAQKDDAKFGEIELKKMMQDDYWAMKNQESKYYFGNINLPRDRFLQDSMKQDEGWVPIKTLLTFNRLASITTDAEVIANAVKAADSEIISISEDGQKIRRNIGNPLPENSLEYWQKIKHCTVYMKGFEQNTTLDEIMTFAKKFGQVENVLMRRTKPERIFKGSVFITYKTREEAEKAQKDDAKFGEIELKKMMQDDYWAMKNQESKEKRQAEKMAKQAKNAAEHAEKLQAKACAKFVKGLILSIDGLPEDTSVQAIKEFFRKYGDVGFVVYESGQSKAEIRFSGAENGAQEAWDKAVAGGTDGKVLFQEKELTAKVLEGEDEEAYWTAFNASKQNKFDRANARRGRGRGRGGFGGRDRGQKRPAERDDAPKGKKIVFDDDGKPTPADAGEAKTEESKPAQDKAEPAKPAEAKAEAEKPAEAKTEQA
ncbi:la domain protein [Oesophagostomum dentatum]|uniref:La domain protein n=1 Tax=Oesophagostomum dentatum TaxID=61180 RepID=A0A0B1SQV4_OESDE|nr:la domain protein [Oesophagostomum dentatum]